MTTVGSTPPVSVQTTAVQQARSAAKPQAATENSGGALFKTAADMVEFAENALDKLASSLGAADGFRRSLVPEEYERDRKVHGEEIANRLKALKEKSMHSAEQMAQTDMAALRGAFSISGELIKRDEQGIRTLGKFTLSGQGPGFAVVIDSEKGASVSTNGGPFTSNFTRITPPQLRKLPYLKAIAETLNVKV